MYGKNALLLLGSALLAVLGCVGTVGTANAAAGQPPLEKFAKISQIVQTKCMACHTRDYDLPFYAAVPGIKQIIEKDYVDGLRALDLNLELVEAAKTKPIGEVALAKMEWVIQNDTMPPAKFTAVHWKSKLTAEDKVAILNWVKTSRTAHYATGPASEARANEPLQPLPQRVEVNAA